MFPFLGLMGLKPLMLLGLVFGVTIFGTLTLNRIQASGAALAEVAVHADAVEGAVRELELTKMQNEAQAQLLARYASDTANDAIAAERAIARIEQSPDCPEACYVIIPNIGE